MPNKQLTRGRPPKATNVANLPEIKPLMGQLPKKIVGSHMGYMQTGGGEHPPAIKGPAIARPAKLPPKPRKGPPQ